MSSVQHFPMPSSVNLLCGNIFLSILCAANTAEIPKTGKTNFSFGRSHCILRAKHFQLQFFSFLLILMPSDIIRQWKQKPNPISFLSIVVEKIKEMMILLILVSFGDGKCIFYELAMFRSNLMSNTRNFIYTHRDNITGHTVDIEWVFFFSFFHHTVDCRLVY